ncbi:MAG: DNA polymerase [Nocardioidaceae bacterium]
MERIGIAVDLDFLERLESEFADAVRSAAQDAYSVIGREVNLGSPKQLQVVLFDELKMPKTKAPRPATRPMPKHCLVFTRRRSTPSCSTCCGIVMSPGCARQLRAY